MSAARAPASVPADGSETKQRLLRAGERLFAEHGVHRVRLREINALAGQRNASALHYHFGSRDGLVNAILARHQVGIDRDIERRLEEVEDRRRRPGRGQGRCERHR